MKARPFHRQRPLAAVAAAYGLGVWAGVSFSWRPVLPVLGLLLSVAAVFLLARLRQSRVSGFLAAFLFLGMLLGGVASHPALPPEGRYQATGVLSADAVLREDGKVSGYLENVRLRADEGERSVSRLYWTYYPDADDPYLPREGDRVAFEGSVYHPQGQVNPYGYDFRLFLLQKGVPAGVTGASGLQLTAHPGRGVFSLLEHARKALLDRTRLIFGEDSALPEALLLGERESLPEDTVRGFQGAGAAHLLAVSGLHVGLLAAVLMLALRRFLGPKPRFLALLLFLLGYCALLGFPAPVTRASLLLLIAAYRRIVRRAPDALTSLSAAFLLILLVRPLDLFSASFQLSFCAVLGIVTLGPEIKRVFAAVPFSSLRDGAATTVSATAGIALPTVQVFHRFAWIGLILNPLLCAVFGVLLPVYGLTLALGCVSLPLAQGIAQWINPVTRGLIACITFVGSLPFASVQLPVLPWYAAAAFAVLCALATRYVLLPARAKCLLALSLVLVSGAAWYFSRCPDVQYIQFSMGQADCAMILDGPETVLIDAGEYGGDPASCLLATARRADHLILTHLHQDHCLGVLALLDREIPIGEVILPEGALEQPADEACLRAVSALAARDIPIRFFAAGDTLSLPRVSLTAVWPYPDTVRPSEDLNRYCLCLRCELDGLTLLSMSDLPGEYEHYAACGADVLKAAHHGARSSTGDSFLDAVSPQIALIPSNGFSDSHPHPDTLSRLASRGVAVYQTGLCGAVTITVRGGQATVVPYLPEKKVQHESQ